MNCFNSFLSARCWARYRQLLPLLDKQLPADVSPELGARFQGFAQHMLASLTAWRRVVCRSFSALHTLHVFSREVELMAADGPAARSGPELAALLQEQLQVVETALGFVDQLSRDYPEMVEAAEAKNKLAACLSLAAGLAESAPVYFAAVSHVTQLAACLPPLARARDQMVECLSKLGHQPVSKGLAIIVASLNGHLSKVQSWCEDSKMTSVPLEGEEVIEAGLHCLLFRSLLGVQEMLKNLSKVSNDGGSDPSSSTLVVMNQLTARIPKLKAGAVAQAAGHLAARFALEPSVDLCSGLADSLQVLATYRAGLTSLLSTCLAFTREFAKLLSVILKVFHQIAIQVIVSI